MLIGQGTVPYALGKDEGEAEGLGFSPEPALVSLSEWSPRRITRGLLETSHRTSR